MQTGRSIKHTFRDDIIIVAFERPHIGGGGGGARAPASIVG
jgi:hypothetical protein